MRGARQGAVNSPVHHALVHHARRDRVRAAVPVAGCRRTPPDADCPTVGRVAAAGETAARRRQRRPPPTASAAAAAAARGRARPVVRRRRPGPAGTRTSP